MEGVKSSDKTMSLLTLAGLFFFFYRLNVSYYIRFSFATNDNHVKHLLILIFTHVLMWLF